MSEEKQYPYFQPSASALSDESQEDNQTSLATEAKIDIGEMTLFSEIVRLRNATFKISEYDTGKSIEELPEEFPKVVYRGLYSYRARLRRGSLLYYSCENCVCPCEGEFVFDLSSGAEAWRGHTLPRNQHREIPYNLEKHVDNIKKFKASRVFQNKKLFEEIETIVAHSPMNAFPDVIVAILGDRYPELRHVGESSFRYQLNSIRRKYIPNHGKLIYPHKVRTISGGTFGREFVSHEIGDFFIMYSEAQEKYLELCRHDTCQIMIDGTFKCVPPEYSQLLICVIYSYEKDFFMPIFQCFMSSKELPAYNFVLHKLKLLLNKHGVKPRFCTCDFEKAEMKALTGVFKEVRLVACFYHFTHALMTKCQHLSLYSEDKVQNTKAMLFAVKGLAFIDPVNIKSKFEETERRFKQLGDTYEQFLRYFAKQFLQGTFSIYNWNYFYMIKSLDSRFRVVLTNNGVEAVNSRLNAHLASMNPTCYDAIQAIKILESMRNYHFRKQNDKKLPVWKSHKSLYEHYIKIAREKNGEFDYFSYNDEKYNNLDDLNEVPDESYPALSCTEFAPSIQSDTELRKKYKVGEESLDAVMNKRNKKYESLMDKMRAKKLHNKYTWWSFLPKLRASIEKSGSKRNLSQILEVKYAKTFPRENWTHVELNTVFKGEDGTAYYKKSDGKIIRVEKLFDFILSCKRKREEPEKITPTY